MEIIQTNSLTREQTRQIQELERVCLEADGLENHVFLSNDINFDRDIPVFFLAVEERGLIGFLTFFIPTREEAEISAIVHPSHRQRGVFTALETAAAAVIGASGIGRTIYSVETKSRSAGEVMKRRGICRILRSEYRMELALGEMPRRAPGDADYTALRATPENIADYLAISNRAYGEESDGYADTIMHSDSRMGYVFYRDGAPVGVFAIGLEADGEPFIFGVAVDEKQRGRGCGRALMERACSLAAQYGRRVQLDVDSENPAAFHLYQSMGFAITFQVDYYAR